MSDPTPRRDGTAAPGADAEGVGPRPAAAGGLPDPSRRLTAAFRAAALRMEGLGVVNPALAVEAVGFAPWDEHWLGVMVTPWFMNLMLLPLAGDAWDGLPPGSKIDQAFPSGSYEFILGEEEGIGRYLMCSLFSPVFEFENQEAAVATAEGVLTGLMDEAGRDQAGTGEREIHGIGNADTDGGTQSLHSAFEDRVRRPISRRDLLRGAFLGGKG
jgi:[NiFe] hydrogenase assembly HybE family chaperone